MFQLYLFCKIQVSCTTMCRAIGEMYAKECSYDDEIVRCMAPVCDAIVGALNAPDCPPIIWNTATVSLRLVLLKTKD
jgi:hypothetical protein